MLLVVASIVIGVLVTALGTPDLDRTLVRRAASLRGGVFGDLLQLLTDIGYRRPFTAVMVVSSGLVVLVTRRPLDGLVVAASVLMAWQSSPLLKQAFERARPAANIDPHTLGFAMPSGHATSTSALLVAVALVLARHRHRVSVTVSLLAVAVLMALSRVVLAAHWPTDVLAGLCLGSGIALIVGAIALRARVRD